MNDRYAVFLSASIPNPGRRPFDEDVQKYNIREAVVALVGVCNEMKLDLVFGGHPAITPLVHHAARSLELVTGQSETTGDDWKVTIYQSLYFYDYFPPEVKEFQYRSNCKFESVPAVEFKGKGEPNEFDKQRLRQLSIREMREAMIGRFRLPFKAGVFIGGMEGILDEFKRFGRLCPKAPRFPLTSTGGATRMGWSEIFDPEFLDVSPTDHPRPPLAPLLQQIKDDIVLTDTQRKLLGEDSSSPGTYTYRTLFRRLLRDIER